MRETRGGLFVQGKDCSVHYEQRRSAEARTGVLALLAGVWLIAAPPLLHLDSARHAFMPCWAPLVLAVVIMLAGLLRALAPLEVPWLRAVTIGLAASLVAAAFVPGTDVSSVVQINQVVVGAGIAVGSLVVAAVGGEWLG